MVRKTKWIENAAPDESLDEFARRAISVRLESVWELLARAADEHPQAEHVHQLRVATRRAMASLRIFDALLPRRRSRKMKKQLKRIRRAAGDARNLDVLAARLEQDYPAWPPDRSAKLAEFIARLRRDAQPPIGKLYAHLSDNHRFIKRTRALLARVRIRPVEEREGPRTFVEAARHDLGSLVEQFFATAAVDQNEPAALHAMRISAKRVRYAVEIFAGAFDPVLRQEIYPLVVEIQEKLGAINDHVTAADLFAAWIGRADDPALAEILQPLVAREHEGIERHRQEFLAWWTAGRSTELRRRFDQQLDPEQHEQSA